MPNIVLPTTVSPPIQFGLRDLLGLMTICGMLMALAPLLGAGPPACLSVMALGLMTKRGWIAILALGAASLVVEANNANSQDLLQQLGILMGGAGICAWYYPRR